MAVDDGGAGHEDEVDDARPQPGLSVEPAPSPGEQCQSVEDIVKQHTMQNTY